MTELLLTEDLTSPSWIEGVFLNPWYTGLGTLASLLGIIFTIVQVTRTQRTSALVSKEVANATTKIKTFLDIASITKMNSEIELAREHIKTNAYDAACVRIVELKRFLCEYKSKVPQKDRSDVTTLIAKLGVDLISMGSTHEEQQGIDKKTLLSHLNKLSDLISDWSGELKDKTYETD